MTAERAAIIRCDVCEEVSNYDSWPAEKTIKEAWELCRSAGWIKRGRNHYCSACAGELGDLL